jgi:hypothetical protein
VSAALLHAAPLHSQDVATGVQVHGFGGMSFGRTNVNRYLSGISQGDYRNARFALNVTAHPTERLAVVSQVEMVLSGGETETELDYAFAEWKFSDAIRLQAGSIKHPFGIYTEVFDVGTVRPFLNLAPSIYGPVGFISESYQGIGLRGNLKPGTGWNLGYNLYGGGITLVEDLRALEAFEGEDAEIEEVSLRDVLGFRVNLSPPISGLAVGLSSFTAVTMDEDPERQTTLGVHAEYLTDRLWIRGEAARHWEGTGRVTAQYIEAAMFLTRGIQAAFMHDRLRTMVEDTDVSAAPNLLRHTESAFGLNYWPTAELGFKSSIHFVSGNRLALPDGATAAELLSPNFDRRGTRLVQLGVQFSF